MITIIRKILTIFLLIAANQIGAQEIWKESFSEPEKGIWGDGNGSVLANFSGVEKWTLEYNSVEVTDAEDYAKTVATSGGRFETRDINGEVTWRSEWIDISTFNRVKVELEANETGSGANEENKYLKAFYRIDGSEEIPFKTNALNSGNWGSVIAKSDSLKGGLLQIVVYMANHYSADKVILDEVTVSSDITFEQPAPGDILLSEILFNPVPEGEDYVEIVNVSDKLVSLKNLFLASRDNDSRLTQIYSVSLSDFPLNPGDYLALTKDTNAVFPFFFMDCAECFWQMEKFPSFNNDEDVVVLLNEEMKVIDEFSYNENMHSLFLSDPEGVSLERISLEKETNQTGNWFSATAQSGYGTPGYKNSQTEAENIFEPEITFEPDAFSPNLDGYNDEYLIHFKFDKPGYVSNAWIFNASGRQMLQLAKNQILPATGEISWDGEDELGRKLPLGVYVVAIEFFNARGDVYQFKDGVVLTDVLE